MRIPRIYTAADLAVAAEVTLEKSASHHLTTVLRAGTGTEVLVFNGDGFDYQARIVAAGKSTCLEITDRFENINESPLDSCLLLASLRKDRMDYAIQKSVELGVDQLIIFHADRSSGKSFGDRAERKLQHWKGVVQSAAEQCGRSHITSIQYVDEFAEALSALSANMHSGSLRVLLSPTAEHSLSAELRQYAASAAAQSSIALAIGPESGFSTDELDMAMQGNFTPVTLGQRILRAETAPICALSVVQATLGDLD